MKRIENVRTLTALYKTHTSSFREKLEYNKISDRNIKIRNLYINFALSRELI